MSIACSDFLYKQHPINSAQEKSLLVAILNNWADRRPGKGESNTSRKVVVSLPPKDFPCTQIKLEGENLEIIKNNPQILKSEVSRRQPEEDSFISNYIDALDVQRLGLKLEESNFAYAVCYSKEALLENNGTRSTDCEWEVVAIISSSVEHEPMVSLTMARNELEKVGGTKSQYSAADYAESVYYWSQRVRVRYEPQKPV